MTIWEDNNSGFSLLEIIVALSLFTIAIIMVTSMYTISSRSYNKASAKAELAQNGRVALNRMNRELRQSRDIVTDLSSEKSNAKSEIMFQNGHDAEETTYIEYYLDGEELWRSGTAYYFSSEEDIYVKYNTRNENDELPEKKILSDNLVGEHFNDLEFWANDELVHIYYDLELRNDKLEMGTSVYSRN